VLSRWSPQRRNDLDRAEHRKTIQGGGTQHTHHDPLDKQESIRGAQYTSTEFARFCTDNRVRTSVGRTGVCWDNAAAESFFAALKNEMYHRHNWPTRARARFAVADYIEVFYNRSRLHSTLGYRTPFEALTEFSTAATAA
jgi:putative transposase